MFSKAKEIESFSKILIYGASGTGKTTLALQASKDKKTAVIDMEKGSVHYGLLYSFDVKYCNDYSTFKKAIAFLYDNQHDYEVLIIDPISQFWNFVQLSWKTLFQGKKKQYEFQPKDWVSMRDDFRNLLNVIINMDMHIICTSHEAILYKNKGFMIPDGYKPDSEKGTNYFFDTTIRLSQNGKYLCCVEKDKTQTIKDIGSSFELKEEHRAKLIKKLLKIKGDK